MNGESSPDGPSKGGFLGGAGGFDPRGDFGRDFINEFEGLGPLGILEGTKEGGGTVLVQDFQVEILGFDRGVRGRRFVRMTSRQGRLQLQFVFFVHFQRRVGRRHGRCQSRWQRRR